MSKSRNISTNSSFVSIRYAPLKKMLSYTDENEKAQISGIDIEALRTISRIVQAIKERIELQSLPDK